jgi:hypothetical protein
MMNLHMTSNILCFSGNCGLSVELCDGAGMLAVEMFTSSSEGLWSWLYLIIL